MELTDLRYFASVASCESFVGGARRCGVTAPAISKSIKKLEEALGQRLLTRTTRSVVLTEAGAIVTEVEEPAILADAREAHATVQNYEAALSLGSDYALHNAQMSGVLSATLESGRAITPDAYDKARAIARRARHAATALFDDCDVLLLPSATGAAPKGLESTGNPVFAKLWTMTGNPSLNVPGLKDTSGLPLGVQMVARFGRDDVLLSAGAALQSCLN